MSQAVAIDKSHALLAYFAEHNPVAWPAEWRGNPDEIGVLYFVGQDVSKPCPAYYPCQSFCHLHISISVRHDSTELVEVRRINQIGDNIVVLLPPYNKVFFVLVLLSSYGIIQAAPPSSVRENCAD
jgi:hypothetical protein